MPRDTTGVPRLVRPGTERGTTVIEMMVATAILAVVLAAVFAGLASAQRAMGTADVRMQTNDQLRAAIDQIDRQVRSGNVLDNPANETVATSGVAPGYSLRIYTQSNRFYQCVQWRVFNGTLQTRSWSVSWQADGQVSRWLPVASDIVNTTAPFTLDPIPAYGLRLVDVDLFANAATSATQNSANVEMRISVEGRNTEYGYEAAACNPVPSP